jgi:tetratricopeptide (TPR) repeat protein
VLLQQAIVIDPGFAEAYLQLAIVAMSRGAQASRREYLQKAAQYADRLSTQQRRFLELQLARGIGQPAKVMTLLDAFIADYPTVEEAYGVATSLYNPLLGGVFDPDKMVSVAGHGVKALPASGPTRNTYGYALLGAGRHEDALREFEKYAALVPREPNPYDSMGEAYLVLGLPEKAIENYSRARAIDPTFDSARNGLAMSLAILGRLDEAIAVDPELAVEKAILLSRAGRYREATQAMSVPGRRVADLKLDEFGVATLQLVESALSLERGHARRAAENAASAERLLSTSDHPRRPTYMVLMHLVAGLAAIRNGNIADARTRLEKQKQIYKPKYDLDVWLHKALEGEIALASGDARLAEAAFSQGEPGRRRFHFDVVGLALFANHLPSRDGRARAAIARGDAAAAIDAYRRLLGHGPGAKWVSMLEPRYVFELARLLEKTGDTSSALTEYERFLELWQRADRQLPELTEARRAVAVRLKPDTAYCHGARLRQLAARKRALPRCAGARAGGACRLSARRLQRRGGRSRGSGTPSCRARRGRRVHRAVTGRHHGPDHWPLHTRTAHRHRRYGAGLPCPRSRPGQDRCGQSCARQRCRFTGETQARGPARLTAEPSEYLYHP